MKKSLFLLTFVLTFLTVSAQKEPYIIYNAKGKTRYLGKHNLLPFHSADLVRDGFPQSVRCGDEYTEQWLETLDCGKTFWL